MRIAVVHPYAVTARAVGGVTRVYELVKFLAARGHHLTVLTHAAAPGALTADPDLLSLGVTQCGFHLPEPRLGQKLAWWCKPDPYYVRRNDNASLANAVASMDAQAPFDVIHLELGYMATALRGIRSGAIRVLAEQELMSRALARLRRLPWRDRTGYERLAPFTTGKVARFERASLRSFDLLYGITPADRDALQAAAGRPAGIFPHVVATHRFPPRLQPGGGDRVLFVANFEHRPNLHGALWFIERVWPLILAQRPDARFIVVGPGLTSAMQRRMTRPGVELAGYAPDLATCYRDADVVVTPLHSGGGMRGKVLEAFASGCAVVGTAIAFEGIDVRPGLHCLAADEPGNFAEAVLAYASSPVLRATHGAAARQLVLERYDAAVVFGRYLSDLESAVAERQSVRRRTIA